MRDKVIDITRGIAILLVVVGHSIQYSVPAYDNNIVFRTIYSFHMPLFMFLSGYTFFFSRGKLNFFFLLKRFNLLVVPFFSWFVLGYYVNNVYLTQKFTTRLILLLKSPDYGLWFLWVLFLINIVFIVIIYFVDQLKLRELEDIILITGIYFVSLIPLSILGLHLLRWHIVFFCIGYFVSKYRQYIVHLFIKYRLIFPILFLVFAQFWNRTVPPSFPLFMIKYLNGETVTNVTKLYLYVTPILGIGTAISFAYIISKTKVSWLFIYLGGITLEIYCLHTFFLHTHGSNLRSVVFTIFVTLVTTIFSVILLKRIKYLRFILFGRSN